MRELHSCCYFFLSRDQNQVLDPEEVFFPFPDLLRVHLKQE